MTTQAARPPLAERALAARVHAVPPSGIRRFFDILATMDDVISLGVGEPDFDTPRVVVEAGVEALREGRTHYTSNLGGGPWSHHHFRRVAQVLGLIMAIM